MEEISSASSEDDISEELSKVQFVDRNDDIIAPEKLLGEDVQVIYAAAAAIMDGESDSKTLRLLQAEAIGIRKTKSVDPESLQVVYATTTPNQEIDDISKSRVRMEHPLLIKASELGKVGQRIIASMQDDSKPVIPLLPVDVSFKGEIALAQSVLCDNDESITDLIGRVRAKRHDPPKRDGDSTKSEKDPPTISSGIQNKDKSPAAKKIRGRKPKEPQKPKIKRKYTKRNVSSK